jgi:hypothetical protein
MPYILKKSNGTTLTTVADGSIDQTTSLTFVGKNYAGYGQILDQNLLYLLENFSNKTSPSNPLQGQMWFDSSNLKLNIYDGTVYRQVSFTSTATSQPNNLHTGDFWFNPGTNQLSINYNNSFIPLTYYGSGGASSSLLVSVEDVNGFSHLVSETLLNNVPAYVSSADVAFQTTSSSSLYGDFPYIAQGITLSQTNNAGKSSLNLADGFLLYGTASDALQAGSLAVNGAANYYTASTSASTGTIAARDTLGNIYANSFIGASLTANSLLVDSSNYRSATLSATPNTIPARDNSGRITATQFIGTATNANLAAAASSLVNGALFNDTGAGADPGLLFTGSLPKVISYNTVGAVGTGTFVGANHLLSPSGYQKFPGGFKMAWGTVNLYTYSGGGSFNFPAGVGFTTVFGVQLTTINTTGDVGSSKDYWPQVITFNATSFRAMLQSTNSTDNVLPVFYTAYGV